jgi:hypothetical protein
VIKVIDVASSQKYLDFTKPLADGYTACYVKLGGDNVPRYVAPNYVAQVDRARELGYRIGHYWVPDTAQDPVGAAQYMVSKLRGWTKRDFIVLDNESYSGNDPDGSGPRVNSVKYTDAQCAAFVNEIKRLLSIPGNQVLVYHGLADARSMQHTSQLATGCNFIIAAYSYAAFTFELTTIPAERVMGHQTSSTKSWPTTTGGTVDVDINAFKDNAFAYDTPQEEEVAFTDADRAKLDNLYAGFFGGGPSMDDDGKSLDQSVAEIHDLLREVRALQDELKTAVKSIRLRPE